jgi:hypothetical protein
MFNIIAAELIFAAIFVSVLPWTWPSPPWNLLRSSSPSIYSSAHLPGMSYPDRGDDALPRHPWWDRVRQSPVGTTPAGSTISITVRFGARVR